MSYYDLAAFKIFMDFNYCNRVDWEIAVSTKRFNSN